MQIFQTSNDISTPEKLASVISNPSIAKYRDIPEAIRKKWIGTQIYALCLILHYQAPSPVDVEVDCAFADQMIMDDKGLAALTQVEMQEAFRRGISKEYGEFYGITPSTLVGFIKAFRNSPKRQEAIAILYAQQKRKEMSAKEQENRLLYELKSHGLQLPFWKSNREKKVVTKEESEAHRQKIAEQRDAILKGESNI